MSKIKYWIEQRLLADDLLGKVIRKFKRRKIICNFIHEIWAADLVDYSKFSEQNKHLNYLLVVVDCCSRLLWVKILKT